jgi:hypothetical protein
MSDSPRPNLSRDEGYLKKVAGTIAPGGASADIPFHYLTEALAALGVSEDPYAEGVEAVVDRAFAAASAPDLPNETRAKLWRLWDYLAEEDPLEPADLIFVFGGISQLAVEYAIQLKKDGCAPRIMFSGRRASYAAGAEEKTEAEKYAEMAVAAGVPESEIVIEIESVNTPENVAKSAVVLRAAGELPRSVIAVSLPYHMRRAALTMSAGFDWHPKIIRRPGRSAKFTRETYFLEQNGWRYVAFEFIKLWGARQMGHF